MLYWDSGIHFDFGSWREYTFLKAIYNKFQAYKLATVKRNSYVWINPKVCLKLLVDWFTCDYIGRMRRIPAWGSSGGEDIHLPGKYPTKKNPYNSTDTGYPSSRKYPTNTITVQTPDIHIHPLSIPSILPDTGSDLPDARFREVSYPAQYYSNSKVFLTLAITVYLLTRKRFAEN
jgi:hypothetical protein